MIDFSRLPMGYVLGKRYSIINVVGVGGMSVVYGAYDLETGDTVAVKMLDLSACETEAAKAEAEHRFASEIDVMSALSHPNIVNIIASGEHKGRPYFVMEYVEANTLKSRIEECGVLDFDEIMYYTKQILGALVHIHSKNIAHCDIKPQNIMLLPDGNIKLTDFGIARRLDSAENRESETAVGTVYYISPEQASGKRLDSRSDLYSLGVMMYEMATGRLPFSAADTSSVSRMHIEQSPVRPRVLDPEICTGLEQIILHAMEKISFMRFSGAEEMLDALIELDYDTNTVFEFNRPDENDGITDSVDIKQNNISGWVVATIGAAAAFIAVLIVTIIIIIAISNRPSAGEPSYELPTIEELCENSDGN